jgi:hypothetical protein
MAASTGNAKALIAAIFLQYVCYAVFYIGDEIAGIAPTQYKPVRESDEKQDQNPVVAQ